MLVRSGLSTAAGMPVADKDVTCAIVVVTTEPGAVVTARATVVVAPGTVGAAVTVGAGGSDAVTVGAGGRDTVAVGKKKVPS